MALLLAVTLTLFGLTYGNHQIHIKNHCSREIWVGTLPAVEGGGFKVGAHQNHDITVNDHWSGRVWGRTGCGGAACETGDCGGGKLQCNGAGGIPPATLAEITFDGAGNQDFYDVSLVDGYNLKMQMYPTPGTHDNPSGHYYCGKAGCSDDLNSHCPSELQVHGSTGVVACKSACLAFNRDDYCCRGAHNTPQTCPYFSYARTFKNACPDAYSYAYDDEKSTFTCRGGNGRRSAYDVVFC